MKKIIAILALSLIVLTSIGSFPSNVKAATLTPVEFSKETRYEVERLYDRMPNTFEALVKLPETYKAGGVIFGNQACKLSTYVLNSIDFSIFRNGYPRIGYKLPSGEVKEYVFTEVDVRTNEYVHVAIVRDSEQKKIHCYVDGELVESQDSDFQDFITTELFCIGSDNRMWDSTFFNGEIKNLTIYADARNQSEIQADMQSVDLNDEDLLSHYDLTTVYDNTIVDKSKNPNNATKTSLWLDDSGMDFDYSYSVSIVGDTQFTTYLYPDKLSKVYDYFINNAKTKNIKHVFGVGDITERSGSEEWQLAYSQIARLDGVVPYSVTRGNHDGVADFNRVFGAQSVYGNQYVDKYSVGYANTVHKFSAGKLDYLVVTLDFGADDNVLEWANSIVEAHPNHNVIVSTHGYLTHTGELIDSSYKFHLMGDASAKNEGIDMWEKFIKNHENIVMVLCGHVGNPDIVLSQMVGEKGNVITQIQVDHQEYEYYNEATGMIANLYFSEDGKKVHCEFYSPIKNQYYRARNQFTFNVNTIERDPTEKPDNQTGSSCGSSVIAPQFLSLAGGLAIALFAFKKRK